jgi:hypothetical protein
VLAGTGPDAAFDTQTGQLCRTWDWQLKEGEIVPKPKMQPTSDGVQFTDVPTVDPKAKPHAQTGVGLTPPGQFSPTCLSLYQAPVVPSGLAK